MQRFSGRVELCSESGEAVQSRPPLGSSSVEKSPSAIRVCPITDPDLLMVDERGEDPDPVTSVPAPRPEGQLIHRLFEDQAARAPHAVAVISGERCLTYSELNRRANRVAHALLQQGVHPDERIGLFIERSLEMVIGVLGILKAGAGYLPLDPSYPAERLAFMVDDGAPTVLVTDRILAGRGTHFGRPVVVIDDQLPQLDANPCVSLLAPQHLAYVIYTSGSTGQPKGVMVEHRNVTRLFSATRAWFHFDERDVWTLFHSTAFDFSVWELWGALLYGGRVIVVPSLTARAPNAFYRMLCEKGVTVLNQTPGAFKQLITAQESESNLRNTCALRLVIFGGDALEPGSLRPWVTRNGSSLPRLVNMYGITETTVHVTYREIRNEDVEAGRNSMIGRPIPDLRVHILDQHLQPVPVGCLGELYVGGAGVARGYLNRPQLTAERFIADRFSSNSATRLYKTGDVGRLRADGDIEYLGRNDYQVKIRGYRIELGEIEAELLKHPHVKEAMVVAREDVSGEKRVVGYVVADIPQLKALREGASGGDMGGVPVGQWRAVFEEAYSETVTRPTFTGWNSSYTAQPIPEEQMKEWLHCTLERILAVEPGRVLEIGCGVGLLLEHLAPLCPVYRATDISSVAIERLRRWVAETPALGHVELEKRGALELQGLQSDSYDTVIMNSVVQYFPDIHYLWEVLKKAVGCLASRGRVFVGDIRCPALLKSFHSSVQLERAPPEMTARQLRSTIARALEEEKELLVDPRFFVRAAQCLPGVDRVCMQLRRGVSDNELTRYRYDAVLEVGSKDVPRDVETVKWIPGETRATDLAGRIFARHPRSVRIVGIPNRRLFKDISILKLIEEAEDSRTVEALRDRLRQIPIEGEDPELFWNLGAEYGYRATVEWHSGGEGGKFDVEWSNPVDGESALDTGGREQRTFGVAERSTYANDPWARNLQRQLIFRLREYLREQLPPYMVPSAILTLDKWPLTANGKLDRHALPSPDAGVHSSAEYQAPVGDIEETLATIWQDLLRIERVGRHDNFFELGGHSLLIMQMIERLHRAELSAEVHRIFESSTLAALASSLKAQVTSEASVPPNLIPSGCDAIASYMLPLLTLGPEHIERIVGSIAGGARNIQDIYPLVPLQEGMLFHHAMSNKGDTYIASTLFELASRAQLDVFVSALQRVVDRHDALRTALLWEQLPRPVQVVCRSAMLPIQELILDEEREAIGQLKESMTSGRQRFELQKAPLMRLLVAADRSTERWYAVLQLHHMVSDLISLDLIKSEVIAHVKGHAAQLLEPIPYRVHVARSIARGEQDRGEVFFRSRLGDIEEPTAPFGLLDVHADGSQIEEASHKVDEVLAFRVRSQARRMKLSVAAFFQAAWGLVVSRTSGRANVVFGTVLSGRMRGNVGGHRGVGLFINTLPIRLSLRGLTAEELLRHTQQELIELVKYEQVPLPVAQRCSPIAGRGPLFTALLNYMRTSPDPEKGWDGKASQIRVLARHWRTNYPIALSVEDSGEEFLLTSQADRRVDPNRIIGYLHTALESLVASVEKASHMRVLSLPVLPEYERSEVVDLFNATNEPYPNPKLIHEIFEEQAERSPDAMAVVYERQALTYADLNARANQLARYLCSEGVRPDQLVGVCVERSIELLVAVLGVWKAGAAYVPLDPSHPSERLRYMLDDAAPGLVLTQRHLRGTLSGTATKVISFEEQRKEISRQSSSNLDHSVLQSNSRHLAYVIYTSGSTGRPKGVMVEHRSVVNHWHTLEDLYRKQPRGCTRIAVNAPFTFDASVQQLVQLLSGCTLFLVPQTVRRDAGLLLDFLDENRIEGIDCTPSQLSAWVSAGLLGKSGRDLRTVLMGGEPVDATLWSELAQYSRVSFYNVYGPTECTVDSTAAVLGAPPAAPHIGRPMKNTRVYILDSDLNTCPLGVTGEICIGGAGVARGYLHRPELSAERFIADPFNADGQRRIYRTGDLARWRPDGTIEYLGRNDNQVKIRGFRVELGEIEAQLARHEQVQEAMVVAREGISGEKHLVGYVVPKDRSNSKPVFDRDSLSVYLRTTLPEHMIPGAFVVLASFPLSPNGKVDRYALPAPEPGTATDERFEAPQGNLEERLASILGDLLGVERLGRRDNFFELGGHSLLAIRVIVRVNQACDCALRVTDLYKSPTVRELATRVREGTTEDKLVNLSAEAVLEAQIVGRPGSVCVPQQGIFLTGATGFVGRFLLAQLLQDTRATVYCLVRAQSEDLAARRLKTILSEWELWNDDFERRVVAIPGDLGLPRLGLNEVTYRNLCERVDSIYHCGSSSNHLETYAMARRVNVGGAREILRLALEGRHKLINYISTLSIFSHEGNTPRIVDEGTSIEHEEHWASRGDAASKWVCEKLFMMASARGIPCNIFRLGLVWADTQEGRYDETQREDMIFKSCLLSGCGIRGYRFEMTPTPVDYVARAVVFLGDRYLEGRGVFHIASSKEEVDGVFEKCNEIMGTTLDLMSFEKWVREVRRLDRAGQPLPVAPLLDSYEHRRSFRSASLRFDCVRTQHELEHAGIVAPAFNDDLLKTYMDRMFANDPALRELIGETTAREIDSRRRSAAAGGLFRTRSAS